MNKVLGGCLIVVALAVLTVGAGGYWFVVRPLWSAGSAVVDAAQQWQQLAAPEAEVTQRGAFDAPADGRLQPAHLERFLAVQSAIADALGEEWSLLEDKYRTLQQQLAERGREPDLSETLGAYQDLAALVLSAKRAQVDALNRSGMALSEYRWIRNQAYGALGLAAAADAAPARYSDSAVANAELMRPHRDLLTRTLAVAWLAF